MPLYQAGPLELYIRTEDGRYVTTSVINANVELEASINEYTCPHQGIVLPTSASYTLSLSGDVKDCTIVDAILPQTSASVEEVIALLDEHTEASND